MVALKILNTEFSGQSFAHPVPLPIMLLFLFFVQCTLEQILPASRGCGSSVDSIKNIVQERSVRPLSQRKPSHLDGQRSQVGISLWNRDTRQT